MRCSSCNKFTEVDSDVEPEVQDEFEYECKLPPSPDLGGIVHGSVRIVNQCADCGDELQEATFEFDIKVPLRQEEGCEDFMEVDAEVSRWDEYRPPGAKRQAHFYGVEVSGTVSCPSCKVKTSFSGKDEVKSSHMDEVS